MFDQPDHTLAYTAIRIKKTVTLFKKGRTLEVSDQVPSPNYACNKLAKFVIPTNIRGTDRVDLGAATRYVDLQ